MLEPQTNIVWRVDSVSDTDTFVTGTFDLVLRDE